MSADEVDASPAMFPTATAARRTSSPQRQHSLPKPRTEEVEQEDVEAHEDLSRHNTGDSSESSSRRAAGRPDLETMRTQSVGKLTPWTTSGTDLERHPTALSRINTIRTQHSHTLGTSLKSRTATRHSRTALPAFGAGKPYPPPLPAQEDYVVEFDGPLDPLHAQNWPLKKKLPVALSLGYITLVASFSSSIFSAATGVVARNYDISTEVSTLGVSLYVLGFALGRPFDVETC